MSRYSQHDIDAALRFAADEWDRAIEQGLHEVGIPVSEILRSLVVGSETQGEGEAGARR